MEKIHAGNSRKCQKAYFKDDRGNGYETDDGPYQRTLFNMIQNDIYGCTFLDLFSGSGAIGIEALSRGAKEAVFVEKNPKAADCIRDNLKAARLADKATLLNCDISDALKRIENRKSAFDFIFMDPPYNHLWEKEVLTYLAHSSLADEQR